MSYKIYYELKSSLLQQRLGEALEDDAFDLSILENSSQTDSPASSAISEMHTPDVSALTNENFILLSDTSTMNATALSPAISMEPVRANESRMSFASNANEFEAETTEAINEAAWGDELNNRRSSSQLNQSLASNKFTRHMSTKLFRNASFTKRNPRKSLSRNSFGSSQSSHSLQSSSQKDALPDLEAILSQKSRKAKDTTDNTEPQASQGVTQSNVGAAAATTSKHIDQSWLERCNDLNGLDSDDRKRFEMTNSTSNEPMSQTYSQPHSQSLSQTQSTPRTFGISNINAAALASMRTEQAETAAAIPKSMLSLDMNNMSLRSTNSYSEPANMSLYNGDDDEEVANSEDESLNESKPQIRSARYSLKRKHNEIAEPMPDPMSNSQQLSAIPVPVEKRTIATVKKRASVKDSMVDVPQVAPATRRSTRNVPNRKSGTYKEANGGDSDQHEAEDIFAGDDSDNDPNFSMDVALNGQSSLARRSTSSNTSEEAVDDQPNTRKVAVKPRQKVVRTRSTRASVAKTTTKTSTKTSTKASTKATTKTATKTTRTTKLQQSTAAKTLRTRKSVTTKPPPIIDDDNEPPVSTESPEDYLLEFGVTALESVPSIALKELKQNSEEFSKYVANAQRSVATYAAASTTTAVVAKNSLAKEKLEKRAAAGTLNENFVRLNLRKKVFVRGKKTMNFSRYKKKLWKSKKAEAISGPDMDMRGCDGGILTCFQCGMPGHFAQNCKIQSDRLLPLDAENDDSPFPTLQEAAEMSKQNMFKAHGSKELPKTDNPLWEPEEPAIDANEIDNDEVPDDDNRQKSTMTTTRTTTKTTAPTYIGHKIPEDFLIKAGLLNNNNESSSDDFQPLYSLNPDGSTIGKCLI